MTLETAVLKVDGMSCQHCVNSVKNALGALNGVQSVEVDLQGKTVTVGFNPAAVAVATIKETIEDQGYDVP